MSGYFPFGKSVVKVDGHKGHLKGLVLSTESTTFSKLIGDVESSKSITCTSVSESKENIRNLVCLFIRMSVASCNVTSQNAT